MKPRAAGAEDREVRLGANVPPSLPLAPRKYAHKNGSGLNDQIDPQCQAPEGKRPPARRYFDPCALTRIAEIMGV